MSIFLFSGGRSYSGGILWVLIPRGVARSKIGGWTVGEVEWADECGEASPVRKRHH